MKLSTTLCSAIFIALSFIAQAQMWPIETIRTNIVGAWTRSADFDKDNDPDILVQSGDTIYWYENLRPGWKAHIIDYTFYYSTFGYVDVLDMDGDGDMDVLKASTSAPGVDYLTWNENKSKGLEWIKHTIIKTEGALGWMQSSYGDLDKDGDLDLVVPETNYGPQQPFGSLYWLENQSNSETWIKQPLNTGAHWYSNVTDIDGDGDLDIVASKDGLYWLENKLPDTRWLRHEVAAGRAFSHIFGVCSDLDSDGTPDIVSVNPTQTNGGLVYYANPNWQRVEIKPSPFGVLEVGSVGDIDGDGDNDITYAGLGNFAQALGWAENQDKGTKWVLHDITPAQRIQMIPTGLADIDGDGDMDIVSLTFDLVTGVGSAFWAANPKIITDVYDPQEIKNQVVISIWPNPVVDRATLLVQGEEEEQFHIQVFDLHGRLLKAFEMRSGVAISQSLEVLSAGVYMIKVFNERCFGIKKFLKN